MKTMIAILMLMFCSLPAKASDGDPAAPFIVDDNWCDPLENASCGYVPIGNGGFDIGGELFAQSQNQPSDLYQQFCTGAGMNTSCQGDYENGYHVHCYLQQTGTPSIWCHYTPPPTQ